MRASLLLDGHPYWGRVFHWWAVDAAGRVALFSSAFGAVPRPVRERSDAVRAAGLPARRAHREWFDPVCHADVDDCPVAHCPVELGHGPYLYTWDEDTDDRYTRFGIPRRPLLRRELAEPLGEAAALVRAPFRWADAPAVMPEYPGA